MILDLKKIVAICCLAAGLFETAHADVTVGVNYGQNWIGYMTVFDLDRSGALPAPGGYVFESVWGFNDLTAEFDTGANTLTLGPNSVNDPDPFWYIDNGGSPGLGNKWMDANGYVQIDDGSLSGQTVTFAGTILSNTFLENHTVTAFIRDFAPDYSSNNSSTQVFNLNETGAFSIELATDAGAGRHVQYGFNVQGENVWVSDRQEFGNVVLNAVPEPGSLAIISLGAIALVTRRRR